jgi:hypothetical protein
MKLRFIVTFELDNYGRCGLTLKTEIHRHARSMERDGAIRKRIW